MSEPTITAGGQTFRVLYPDLLRPLTAEEAASLRESIRLDGVRAPVVTDEEGGIIDGANRARIAAELGLVAVPVQRLAGLTEESKRRLALELNLSRRQLSPEEVRQARQHRIERVAEARREGKSTYAIAEEEGISQSQVRQDLQQATEQGCLVEPASGKVMGLDGRERPATRQRDSEAEREKRHQTRQEALQSRADAAPAPTADTPWRLIHGPWQAGIAEVGLGTVRLAFMDPPYNIGFDYGDGPDADLREDEEYLAEMLGCIRAVADRLTADGSLWVLINDEYAGEFAVRLKRAGLSMRNWVKWYETFGVNCTGKFNRTSRHLLYFVKDPSCFVFNAHAARIPSARQAVYNDPRANPDGKVMDDVWTDIPRLAGTHAERIPEFPTQLPLALLDRIVRVASHPGDLVLDPFSGSATTGLAALRLGRRYVGLEQQKRFVDLSALRLRGEHHDPA